MNVAIILAGGVGKRASMGKPKQFVTSCGSAAADGLTAVEMVKYAVSDDGTDRSDFSRYSPAYATGRSAFAF